VIDFGVFSAGQEGRGFLLSHALALKSDAVGIVHNLVEDGVGDGAIAEHRRVLQPSTGSFLTSRSRIGGTPYSAIGLRF